MFRVRRWDASARLGELKTKSGTLTTPAFFPVYNPNKPVVSLREMQEMGVDAIITNSYVIFRNPRLKEKALNDGIHRALGFNGVIFTDSGAYQLYRYGSVEISNREIIEFQHKIGSDIASILDVPMATNVSREKAERGVEETIKNAKEWAELREQLSGTLWVGTPQGSVYEDLVTKSAKAIRELDFDYNGVGSLKVGLERYDFWTQAKHFMLIRSLLKAGKPFHFWGIGHPSTFAFFSALGADSFDSASYALYARESRYMTPEGTLLLEEIEEFPCSCPVCSRYTPEEVRGLPKREREKLLALHNLYVMLAEMRKVREAIRGEWLWELVQEKARFHPKLLQALLEALRNGREYFLKREPESKSSGLFYSGSETRLRPEVVRAREKLSMIRTSQKTFFRELYGEVPIGLRYTYPFGQTIHPYETDPEVEPDDSSIIEATLKYHIGNDFYEKLRGKLILRRSKKTGMPREILLDGKSIGVIRSSDGMFIPSLLGAELIVKLTQPPKRRVIVKDRYAKTVARGTTVFVKFVSDLDPDIRPKSEVVLVDERDSLLGTGKAILPASELMEYHEDHPFVLIRRHVMPREV